MLKPRTVLLTSFLIPLLLGILTFLFVPPQAAAWNDTDLKTLYALSLSNLPPLAPDASNRVADDPRAVALGQSFFLTRV